MKRNLLLVSAIVVATLASCTKESELDPTIESAMNTQSSIQFSTYASDAVATKGTAINSNSRFQSAKTHGSFDVSALVSSAEFILDYTIEDSESLSYHYTSYTVIPDAVTATLYFNPSTVTYDSDEGKWENQNSMYWPNDSKMMHFAAYSPSGVLGDDVKPTFTQKYSNVNPNEDNTDSTYDSEYSYSFPYEVTDVVANQIDLMYAMTTVGYISPSDQVNSAAGYSYITNGEDAPNYEDSVNLHFKHALTQIAFTATKDSDIDVYVKSITICNVYNSGTFTATDTTDDEDTSDNSTDSSTVGDSGVEGDLVNADNFGSWEVNYEGTWAGLVDNLTDNNAATDDGNLEGSFYTTEGSGGFSAVSNYEAAMASLDNTSPENFESIQIGDDVTQLTSTTNVLMLMPQTLSPWVPTSSTELNYVGSYRTDSALDGTSLADGGLADGEYANTSIESADRSLSYLAIDCEIYHTGSDEAIHTGYIFVPFDTKNINYTDANVDTPEQTNVDAWLPGYKITYCLNFGGGYIVEEGHTTTIPEPGCIPDTETYTLRTITYTTTVDTFVAVTADTIDFNEFDTSATYPAED